MSDGAAGAALPPPVTVALFLPVEAGLTVPITLHPALVESENRHTVSVLGARGTAMLLSDVYVSRNGVGEEHYLRVVDTEAGEERWWLLAASAALGLATREPLILPVHGGAGFIVALADRPDVTVTFGEDGTVSAF